MPGGAVMCKVPREEKHCSRRGDRGQRGQAGVLGNESQGWGASRKRDGGLSRVSMQGGPEAGEWK